MMEEDDEYRVHLNAGSGQVPDDRDSGPEGPQRLTDLPFCLGILGDFSGLGAGNQPGVELEGRRWPLVRVTPENVLNFAGFSPRVSVGPFGVEGESGPEEIGFSTFDDFHPEQLFHRMALLDSFRRARSSLLEGEEGVDGPGPVDAARGPTEESEPETSRDGPPGTNFLDAVLEETKEDMAAGSAGFDDDLDGFIRRVVRPHVLSPGPDHTSELEVLDTQASKVLGRVIDDPAFRSLESLWRSVVFLLSKIEVGSNLRIYLVDISKSDLQSDLLGTDEPTDWALGSLFIDPVSENGELLRWAGLIGAYSFGQDPDDVPLLQRIGFLSEAAEVPWFSGGQSRLLGCSSLAAAPEPRDWTDSVDPRWIQLRQNPEASWISLAFPEFLVRSAYEKKGKRKKDQFRFVESVDSPAHLLWGNPAFLCGVELARAFKRSGWAFRPGRRFSVENVPVHLTEEGWASPVLHPLSHHAASETYKSGLIPLVASRDEPSVRIEGLRPISDGQRAIQAWWG